MTGTVIRTFGEAYSFKVGSLFGTDERPARPRMTRDGHPYLWKSLKFKVGSLFGTDERLARPRMTGTVIRTFESAGSSWGFFDKLLMQRGQKP
jgi:hypothetical protein